MGAWVDNAAVAAGTILAGVSLTLAIVGLVAWRRLSHLRLLWVSLAFVALAAQGAILTFLAYGRRGSLGLGDPLLGLTGLGLATALLLYAGVLKR